jgi:hypothetical protein
MMTIMEDHPDALLCGCRRSLVTSTAGGNRHRLRLIAIFGIAAVHISKTNFPPSDKRTMI